jgi:hypothetical protein
VGRAKLPAGAVVASEDDGAAPLPARHVEHLRGVVEDLVRGDEAERPAHELDDRAQSVIAAPIAMPGESGLGDRGVDDALRAELVEHALADLVRAVVLGDFLTDEEDRSSSAHLLCSWPRAAPLETESVASIACP